MYSSPGFHHNNHHIEGSYLVKRSAFSKRFLRGWADYESLLPRSFHGRDNGAIHMWLIKQLPWLDGKQCEILWNASTGYLTLSYFTVCCREVLQAANFSNIRILEKNSSGWKMHQGQAWARDSWLTNSHWNPEVDFMFHVRKEVDKQPYEANDIGQVFIMEKVLIDWWDRASWSLMAPIGNRSPRKGGAYYIRAV
ncbi:hypothetical protein COOONC_11383 [Cooperia oncophora]